MGMSSENDGGVKWFIGTKAIWVFRIGGNPPPRRIEIRTVILFRPAGPDRMCAHVLQSVSRPTCEALWQDMEEPESYDRPPFSSCKHLGSKRQRSVSRERI